MKTYRVPLVRETTEYEWATVEVEAESPEAALEAAIELAENDDDEEVEWNDHGTGYGGCDISKTPNEEIEEVEDEEEDA